MGRNAGPYKGKKEFHQNLKNPWQGNFTQMGFKPPS